MEFYFRKFRKFDTFPILVIIDEREESVVKQKNLFRKMLYSNNETTCFGL